MDTQDWDRFLFAAVFVTVVWVLSRIASDFGVSICCFMFFWPKFRPLVVWSYGYPRNTHDIRFWPELGPASQNGISAQWFNMQSSAGRNFGHVIRFSCQAVRFGPFLVDLCLLFAIWELSPS